MTLEQFNELIESIDANGPTEDGTLEHDYDREWGVQIKNVYYHRFIREDNQMLIKIEHDDGGTMGLALEDSDFSCSYNHNFDKMLCLIIKKCKENKENEINNN